LKLIRVHGATRRKKTGEESGHREQQTQPRYLWLKNESFEDSAF
jgi:hypothetical protein